MDLRIAWQAEDDPDAYTVNGLPVVKPGEEGDLVLLARVELAEATGSESFDPTDSELICTVDGVRYLIEPALVRHTEDGTLCDAFLFVGVPTT